MRTFSTLLALGGLLLAGTTSASAVEVGTHGEIASVRITGESGAKLLTLATTSDGTLAALLGSGDRRSTEKSKLNGEVQLLDADGKKLQRWPLDFNGQSIGAGPDGSIYVAGDGQLAKYSPAGKLLVKVEIPHIAEVVKDSTKLRALAEAQIAANKRSYEAAIKGLTVQLDELRAKAKTAAKPPEVAAAKAGEKAPAATADEKKVLVDSAKVEKSDAGLSDDEKEQLRELESILKVYKAQIGEGQPIEATMEELTSRLRYINSIAATEKDVFFACGEMKGHGYAVWRMDTDFKNPTEMLNKLGGCCGQMDVQAKGDVLYVAENTRHRVGQYNRDGKQLSTFGNHSREESSGLNFGGCCNPMNCRICANGDVFTAESEGIIKRFNSKGEYVSMEANVKLDGGCKNVAVAASPSGDKVYLCDQPGSKIVILGKRTPEQMKAAEEKAAAEEKQSGNSILQTIVRALTGN